MLLKKTESKIPDPRLDLLIDIPNGNFTIEISQRSESDMFRMMQSYIEMDREVSLLNG